MANCTYEITVDGKVYKFSSDLELDSFLNAYYQDMVVDKTNATLQVDPKQVAIDNVNKIIEAYKNVATKFELTNEDGEKEVALKIDNSIGVTKFITSYGEPTNLGKTFVPEFNLTDYLRNQKEVLIKNGLSASEADTYLADLQKSWTKLTDYGSEVHQLFESILNPEVTFKQKALSDNQVTLLKNQFKNLIEDLKNQYGHNAQFFTEVPIVSSNIHEAYKKAGIDSINGRIDLLIIDENGNVHIRDFKVSKTSVGPWEETSNRELKNFWVSSKKLSAAYQLGFYKAMLEQNDLRVATVGIIPVKLDIEYNSKNGEPDLSNIKGIQEVSIESNAIVVNPYNTTGKYYERVKEILPITSITDNLDIVKLIQEPMSKFVPNYELSTKVQRRGASVEFFRKKPNFVRDIPPSDKEANYGRYKFFDEYSTSLSKWVYAQNEEDLQQKLKTYVDKVNEIRGNEMATLANNIELAISGSLTLDQIVSDKNRYKGDYTKRVFKKYIEGKWKFESSPSLISAGIFIFTKNGLLEVVSLSASTTHQKINLGQGTSILGATKKNETVNEHNIFATTNGNIDLIKVMCLLNGEAERFSNYKISKIINANIWHQTGSEQYMEKLYDNFVELCRIHNVPVNIKKGNFATTLESVINSITDTCGEDKIKNIGNWKLTYDGDTVVDGVPYILDRMEELRKLDTADELRKAIRTNKWNFDDPLQVAYMLLGKALNKLQGYEVYIEPDPTKWVNVTGSFHIGTNITSINNSPSLTAQEVGRIVAVTETRIRRAELTYDSKIRKTFKAFYEYNNRNKLIGGEVKYFDNLFVRDSNGDISKSFILKHPTDSSLAKEESDLITLFLDIVNNLKYNGSDYLIEQAKEDGSYYEVPLAIGSMRSQLHNKGFKEGLKAEFHESLNWLRLFTEQEGDFEHFREQERIYNKYKISSDIREKIIENHGINGLETQLEDLLRNYIHSYVAETEYNNIIPQIQGIKIALQYNQAMYGQEADNLLQFLDKYLTVNIFNKPIMDKGLQPVYKVLSAVKSFTTASVLGFNIRSGLREMMQGMWIHISRTMAGAYGKDQFTGNDLRKAWGLIFRDAPKRVSTLTKLEALNADYGMANMDADMVQKELSESRMGVKNFNSDMLYVCNRAPDFYHRMGLLLAKMIHDGCYEAHSLNENDELIYDFKKDKRFSLLNDVGANKDSKEYKAQHGLYEAMRIQFNKEGFSINEGEPLPRAYTVQEATSIKSFAEMCFGHYDKNTQMLAKHMFMGAMMLHFRTFISAKLEQWILAPGTYDQGRMAEKFDENGIRYMTIYTYNPETNLPSSRVDLETNIKPGEYAEPYYEWQGRYMEGIAYSMWSMGAKLAKLDFQGLKEIWANPTKRANFYLFLTDMIFMGLMMLLIQAVFLSGDSKEDLGALGTVGAMALYTSFQDGPINNIIMSMGGDLNPPAYSIIKNVYKQTMNVVTGDQNLWDGAVNTFGVLSPLKYLSDQLPQ